MYPRHNQKKVVDCIRFLGCRTDKMKWLTEEFKTRALRNTYTQINIQSTTVFRQVKSPYSFLQKFEERYSVSLNGASDFSSSTSRWKRNNAFSVSPDVPNGFCFYYFHVHLKLQPIPSVVFFFNGDCIFRPLTEMALVFNLFVSALRKFSGYETVINLTWAFCAADKTWIIVCFKIYSGSTQAGRNSKVWWGFEGSVWQNPSRCPKLTSSSWCCLLTYWAFCEHIKISRALHKLGGNMSGNVCPVVSKRFWTVVFSSV